MAAKTVVHRGVLVPTDWIIAMRPDGRVLIKVTCLSETTLVALQTRVPRVSFLI